MFKKVMGVLDEISGLAASKTEVFFNSAASKMDAVLEDPHVAFKKATVSLGTAIKDVRKTFRELSTSPSELAVERLSEGVEWYIQRMCQEDELDEEVSTVPADDYTL